MSVKNCCAEINERGLGLFMVAKVAGFEITTRVVKALAVLKVNRARVPIMRTYIFGFINFGFVIEKFKQI